MNKEKIKDVNKEINKLEDDVNGKGSTESSDDVANKVKKALTDVADSTVKFVNEKVDVLKDKESRQELIDNTKANIDKVIVEGSKQIDKIKNDEKFINAVDKTKEVTIKAYETTKKAVTDFVEDEKVQKVASDVVKASKDIAKKSSKKVAEVLSKTADYINKKIENDDEVIIVPQDSVDDNKDSNK